MKSNINNELLDYIDNSVINSLYKERESELYQITLEEKEKIKKLTEDYPVDQEKLIIIIKNLPPSFYNIRESILKSLGEYLERESVINAYDNERFYKAGFFDAINLILEAIKKEK